MTKILIILSMFLCSCGGTETQDLIQNNMPELDIQEVIYPRNFNADLFLEPPDSIEDEVLMLQNTMKNLFLEIGGNEGEMIRRDVEGLARFLVYEVEDRHQRGEWLPLGREKAPAFLAAVALHESSWKWRDINFRGDLGERCAFQVSRNAMYNANVSPYIVASNPEVCLDVALGVFEGCMERCGNTPAEDWMSCYARRGECSGASWVVKQRFETTRRILAGNI